MSKASIFTEQSYKPLKKVVRLLYNSTFYCIIGLEVIVHATKRAFRTYNRHK